MVNLSFKAITSAGTVKGAKILVVSLLLFSLTFLTACSQRKNSGIIIAGSTSIQPYAEKLAEEYEKLNPGDEHRIDIQGGGSSAGITATQTGTAHIGMSSRNISNEEKSNLSYIIEIARDGLAIIVHPDNPVRELTLEQVRKIYTREITNWEQLGGQDADIHIIAREDGSGTRSVFEEKVMEEHEINAKAIVQDSNGSVRLLVSDDEKSIGFISLGLVEGEKGQKPVKALCLDGVEATRENVKNESYSLYRSFLFVAKTELTGSAKQFIDFILSAHGKEILINEGLIPG